MRMEDNFYSIAFLLFYLLCIWITLVFVLIRNRDKLSSRKNYWRFTFLAYFLLAFGDIFHLGSRTIIFVSGIDPNLEISRLFLGLGLILTGLTVTYFYVAFFHLWKNVFSPKYSKEAKIGFYIILIYYLFIIRILLILTPFNNWFYVDNDESYYYFRLITNIPLYIIGISVIYLLLRDSLRELKRKEEIQIPRNLVISSFYTSILFVLSFIFYTITIFGIISIPLLGMFMIPKTIAYLIALYFHVKYILIGD